MLNILHEKESCNCGLYCAIFLSRQHLNASVVSQQIVTSSNARFLRGFSVCINSGRLLLHDLSLSGPWVWWSCRHLLLLGHHLCWSHVHPGLHRDPAGEIHNLCALWVCRITAFPLHGTVRFGTARLRYGSVQFSTAIEWAGLFTRPYNCAASTAVSVWHSSTCHVKNALSAKTNALCQIMTY